jgi:hypothetical protein
MPRKKLNDELPPEVFAVLRISPDLKPCQKFRKANIYQFAERLNEGKCEQCLALSRPVGEGTAHDEISAR